MDLVLQKSMSSKIQFFQKYIIYYRLKVIENLKIKSKSESGHLKRDGGSIQMSLIQASPNEDKMKHKFT